MVHAVSAIAQLRCTIHTHGPTTPICFIFHNRLEQGSHTPRKQLGLLTLTLAITNLRPLHLEVSQLLLCYLINALTYLIEWPIIDSDAIDNTQLAAVAAWHTIQAFFTNLAHLDSKIKSKSFNLWTESYGGHCKALEPAN
jgi:hypothetical protein